MQSVGDVGMPRCMLDPALRASAPPPAMPRALILTRPSVAALRSDHCPPLRMSALPQVYATEADLAASDSLRDTATVDRFYQQTQQPQYQQNDFARSQPQSQQQRYSPSMQQQQPQYAEQSLYTQTSPPSQFSRSATGSSHPQSLPQNGLRPLSMSTVGIVPVPKDAQSSWQGVMQRGAYQYNGNTYRHHLESHLPTVVPASGHASGPQHLPNARDLQCLPDAPHRTAWSNQPSFRFFKRSNYDDVPDRWAAREGLKGRGDNYYRPTSVREQQEINARVARGKALKGAPRYGEW